MGSKRLPGKSMMDLAGQPLVKRILERVKRSVLVDDIVLAIPNTPENKILKALADREGVKCYAGSEFDILDRYYQVARLEKADVILRLPADNPVPEPSEIDRIIKFHRSLKRPGFSSNLAEIFGNGYPDGIGAEIFDYKILDWAWRHNKDSALREHIHLNFFDYTTNKVINKNICPVATLKCPKEFSRPDLVLDVNTQEQYEFMRELYGYLFPKNNLFHITDIIDWYDNKYIKQEGRK